MGTASHETISEQRYSTHGEVFQAIYVFSSKYNLLGKIDLYDREKKLLTERKRMIKCVYDGYIFQLYGQYFGLEEMGYPVEFMRLYSQNDNKIYPIPLPRDNQEMFMKFEQTIQEIEAFDLASFVQKNPDKCVRCIYAPVCDRRL